MVIRRKEGKEYYYDGRANYKQLTDEEYCDAVESLTDGYEIKRAVIDPSAASFITALKRRKFRVQQADNAVLDGIRRTAVYLKNGNIKIHRCCTDAIRSSDCTDGTIENGGRGSER